MLSISAYKKLISGFQGVVDRLFQTAGSTCCWIVSVPKVAVGIQNDTHYGPRGSLPQQCTFLTSSFLHFSASPLLFSPPLPILSLSSPPTIPLPLKRGSAGPPPENFSIFTVLYVMSFRFFWLSKFDVIQGVS